MAAVGTVDVELLLIQWLQAQLGSAVLVRDELDNNLADELPTVQVERIPAGGDDGFRLEQALVDINVYAATRAAATALALQVRGLLTTLPGTTTGGGVVTRVSKIAGPAVQPYENTALRRVGTTYEIYSHPA